MSECPIHRLSNELLRLILDQIDPQRGEPVPLDNRQFLSVESFDRPPPAARGSIRDVGNFRATCTRFADIGAPLLFTRVAARFSKAGLRRLELLASWQVARHVKKFSYLLPYFYSNSGGEVRLLLPNAGDATITFDWRQLRNKAEEQRQIVGSQEDIRVLKKAIGSFTSLQFVQLLRVTDEDDRALLSYIRQHEQFRRIIDLEWAPACSHGSQTLGTALMHSNVPWTRFSSPMLSPASAGFLASHRPQSLSTLAARLTCLTLHFDDGNDLDLRMSELSALFRTVSTTAVNMQAVHVGFPSHRPLSLPLESVFHNVVWDKLVAFGIQGWKLDADEIIALALRHRERLKGLRLRDVLLKDGSMWRDVLVALRECMRRLEWVSLRRIGYVRHFDDLWQAAGAEVPDDAPPGESDSETGSDEDGNDPIVGPSSLHPGQQGGHGSSGEDSSDEATDSESDDDRGPEADGMDFPSLDSPDTPASAPWCDCDRRMSSLSTLADLGDDAYSVSNTKRKAWEQWAIRQCPEHSER